MTRDETQQLLEQAIARAVEAICSGNWDFATRWFGIAVQIVCPDEIPTEDRR